MTLSRKLIVPTVLLFAIVLAGLLFFVYISYQQQNKEEERRILTTMENSFTSEVESLRNLALSLAVESANNPSFQEAFAQQDREKLLELTQPTFERLKQYNVAQYQFHLAPAISFLRVHTPDKFGDDLSSFRPTVIEANTLEHEVSGIESGRGGLGMRGVVPMYYSGAHIGSVEFGINIGQPLLERMQAQIGGEWHILVTRESMANALPEELAKLSSGPSNNLLVLASTQDNILYNTLENYNSVLQGNQAYYHTVSNNKHFAIVSTPIYDYSGKIIGVLDIIQDRTLIEETQDRRLLWGGLIGGAALLLVGAGMAFFTSQTLSPIQTLTTAATQITQGDLSQEVKVNTNDEIGVLAAAFNTMTFRIRDLLTSLEKRVNERTSQLERRTNELEIIAEVASEITTIRDLSTLLNVSSALIRDRFNYYQVGIFMVDERGEYAVLRAASGFGAAAMLENHHKLRVGEVGIVGYVASTGMPRIALDVGVDATHFRNPDLPDTRSEVGIPLRSQSVTIGVLDIQAVEPSAFDKENIKTLELLASQLQAAIENAQLSERADNAVKELRAAHQIQTQRAWVTAIEGHGQNTSLEFDGVQVKPVEHKFPSDVVEQLRAGKAVVVNELEFNHGEGEHHHSPSTLIVPIVSQNAVIGVIGLEQEDPNYKWSPQEIAIAEAGAARAAITLENARLLEESQKRAVKERTISEATARIGSALDLENILHTTAEELERVLRGADVTLQFRTDDERNQSSEPVK